MGERIISIYNFHCSVAAHITIKANRSLRNSLHMAGALSTREASQQASKQASNLATNQPTRLTADKGDFGPRTRVRVTGQSTSLAHRYCFLLGLPVTAA